MIIFIWISIINLHMKVNFDLKKDHANRKYINLLDYLGNQLQSLDKYIVQHPSFPQHDHHSPNRKCFTNE